MNRLLIVETKENFNQMFGSSVAQARSWAVGASQRGREGGGGGRGGGFFRPNVYSKG